MNDLKAFPSFASSLLTFYSSKSFLTTSLVLLTVVYYRIVGAFNGSGVTRAVALDILKVFDRV